MHRTSLALLSVTVIAAASCSQTVPPASGPDSAGAPSGTSGATGTSGAPTGTAGAPAAGGATGTSGATGTGGAATTGGTTGSSGATATGGAATTGGSAGTTSAGGTATGGTGGTGISVASIVPTLDGFMWVGTCSGAATVTSALDCTINNDQNVCPSTSSAVAFATRGAIRTTTHTVGGTAGTKYIINFEVRGVAGGKFYTGGTQPATTYSPTCPCEEDNGNNNGWYVGGLPTESLWNTYEIHVTPPVPGEANVYYLNAFPAASGYDGRHETFVMKYKASFAVLGGGSIRMVLHDSNCAGQQNCGKTVEGQASCTMSGSTPRTVDLTGMSPQPAVPFTGPYVQNGFHPQWLFFDVQSITQ